MASLHRVALTALTVIALSTAGCLQGADLASQSADDLPVEDALDEIGHPIVQTHDHTDASLHTASANMDLVTWEPFIPEELGEEGFAGLRTCDDRLFLATDGAVGGFIIADVSDPTEPEMVGRYITQSAATQEALPLRGCEHVLLNTQDPPGAVTMAEHPEEGTGTGIQIVDVRDETDPKLVRFHPVEIYGSHNIQWVEIGGEDYVFWTGQPLGVGVPGTDQVWTEPVGNKIQIARFVTTPEPHLEPVTEWRLASNLARTTTGGSFPHDMTFAEHPMTGQMIMYVAHWDGGTVTVDVSDPTNPTTLDVHDDPAPSKVRRSHHVRMDPTLRDGRVIVVSAPEIGAVEGESGVFRFYDATDPEDLQQIATWELPGDVEIPGGYVFSPHQFNFQGDTMALAHYHAGVWLLDVSDPEDPTEVGFYLPHGEHDDPYEGEIWRKTPNFPEPYFPNVFGVRWYEAADGETYLLSSERGSGLYVLQVHPSLEPLLTAS